MDDRGGDSPGRDGADSTTPTAAESSFDLADFKAYLLQLLPLIIQADASDLDPLLESKEFRDRASRWATDSNAGALYVVKQRAGPAAQGQSRPEMRMRSVPRALS